MAYTINLTHRGPQVISGFDLFDECHYGADKLFLRGHFCCPTAIKEQVKIALGGGSLDEAKLKDIYETEITPEFKKHMLGIGDPLTVTPENGDLTVVPTIALNRYHIPNKKFWNNTPPSGIANPYKASAAVTFSLRVYFRDDYAYINFGMPWAAVMDETKDEVATVSLSADEIIKNFRLLQCHFISKEDALQILNGIFEGFGTEVVQVDEVLEIFTDDGEAISL